MTNTHFPRSLSRALLVGLLTVSCDGEERVTFGPGTGDPEPSTGGEEPHGSAGSSGSAAGSSARDAAPHAQDNQGGSTSDPGDKDQADQEDADQAPDPDDAEQAPDPDDAGNPHPTTHTHCGWNGVGWYFCGHNGADPSGQFPIDCPAGLVVGAACGSIGSEGCCDDDDRNWFCTPADRLVVIDCE